MSEVTMSETNDREGLRAQVPPEVEALLKGLLPEQRRIVTTLDRPVFVAAGAGSGKTFTLTRRIVWALCPGSGEDGRPFLDSLDQALVITFTEKAAGEIKERVRSALRQAGLAHEALKVDSAWVSTIHHMCARILRAHALDLGLDPEFSMIGEQEAQLLRAQATEQALHEQQGSAGLDALYAEFGTGDGSGRDGVPGLLATLVSKAGSAERGLESLSFVNASADVSGSMAALTRAYESLCACELKHEDELARCRGELARLEEFAQLPPSRRTPEAARELLDALKGPNGQKWRAKAVKEFSDEAKAALELARGEAGLACAIPLEEPLMALAERIEQIYSAAKRQRGVLDNDDLLQLTARAFREHADIADEYSHRFRLVMVDEFQDTNAQQVGMVKSLSGRDACHLTTVGDAQQAIYGFRGADVSVFEDRGDEVRAAAERGQAATVELAYNFRSDDAILRFVARACGDSGIVPRFMDLRPDPARKSEWPERRCPRVVVELTRAHKLGQRSVPKETRTGVAAAQLADRLARIREQAGVEPRRMAVLMRSLTQAPAYIDALRSRGLESVVVGGSTFAQAGEVRVVEALLRCLACPQDTKSGLFGVLEGGMFELDGNDMLMLATRPQDVFDAPAKRRINVGVRDDAPDFGSVAPSERLLHARRVITRAWDRVGKMPVADVLLMAIRESGWLARLERQGVAGRAVAANVLAAVRHVRELAEPSQLDAILAADEFSRWLEAAKEGPASLSGEGLNAVSLMTAHASKGLEFDVVAVVGCCGSEVAHRVPRLLSMRDGAREVLSLAPGGLKTPDLGEDAPAGPEDCGSALEWRSLMETSRAEAESREDGRLLYVALTRARECVILCLSATEKKGGELSPAMTQQIAGTVFGDRPVAGEDAFEYGGRAAGLVRCVDASLLPDGSVEVESGGTLDASAVSGGHGAAADGGGAGAAAPREPFLVFDIDAETRASLGLWRPREGVFSYSSAHAALAADEGPTSLDDVLALPACLPASGAEGARAGVVPAGDAPAAPSPRHARAVLVDDDGEPSDADDADRATCLGSAFHELARLMVETGHAPSERRVSTVAAAYGVTRRDRARLDAALARWETSDIRAEALAHACVRAEVPFFCEASSPLGHDLEGAIDLLATDATVAGEGSSALLVDYKTGDHGLTLGQIRDRHEMQARFYAYVLRREGWRRVTCAFVCVELEGEDGQPVVIRYEFE